MEEDYLENAGRLQRSVMDGEREQVEELDIKYSDALIRLSIVHTRQDIVLLVSYLGSVNKQLRIISKLCLVTRYGY